MSYLKRPRKWGLVLLSILAIFWTRRFLHDYVISFSRPLLENMQSRRVVREELLLHCPILSNVLRTLPFEDLGYQLAQPLLPADIPGTIASILKSMEKGDLFTKNDVCNIMRELLVTELIGGSHPCCNTHKQNREQLDHFRHIGDWRVSAGAMQLLGLVVGVYDYTPIYKERGSLFLSDSFKAFGEPTLEKTAELRKSGVVEFGQVPATYLTKLVASLDNGTFVDRSNVTKFIVKGLHPERVESGWKGGTYWLFDQNVAMSSPEIQAIAYDPFVLDVVQQYLGAPPIILKSDVWFTLPKDVSRSTAAAFTDWHVDFNTIKTIKLFILLTDVDENTGPHTMITGTHNSFHFLSDDKYSTDIKEQSVPNDPVIEYFGAKSVLRMTRPAGTILLEDTHNFHKVCVCVRV